MCPLTINKPKTWFFVSSFCISGATGTLGQAVQWDFTKLSMGSLDPSLEPNQAFKKLFLEAVVRAAGRMSRVKISQTWLVIKHIIQFGHTFCPSLQVRAEEDHQNNQYKQMFPEREWSCKYFFTLSEMVTFTVKCEPPETSAHCW